MAYLGVQSKGDEMKGRACAAFQNILQSFKQPDGPARHDLVQFVDGQGYLNLIAVALLGRPDRIRQVEGQPGYLKLVGF